MKHFPASRRHSAPTRTLFSLLENRLLLDGTGLAAVFFANQDLTGASYIRLDPQINLTVGNAEPAPNINRNSFSVRWTGYVVPRYSETYTFTTTSDDGVRLWVNDQLLVNNWTRHAQSYNSAKIALTAGVPVTLRMEFFQGGGDAVARLEWASDSQKREIVPASQLYPGSMPEPPAAPTSLNATALSTSSILLHWTDNATNETGYTIDRSLAGASQWTTVATLPANSTSWLAVNLGSNTGYSFRVTANGSNGNAPSAIASAVTWPPVPATPGNVRTTSGATVGLSWNDVANETGYEIQRSTTGSDFAIVATLAANTTSWTDTTVDGGWTYSYRLRAVNQSGVSSFSGSVTATAAPPVLPVGTGLRGLYFDTPTLTGNVVSQVDATIGFNWNTGAPLTGFPSDRFSVRWSGQLLPKYTDTYTLYTTSDDGIRLWVNGQLLIDNWTEHAPMTNTAAIPFVAGQQADIVLEYFEKAGGATVQLEWSSRNQSRQLIPAASLFPAPDPLAVPPTAPTHLSVTPASASQLTLNWTDNANNETGFRIERSTDNVNFVFVTAVNANTNSYLDSGLAGDTTYYYRVQAANGVGYSGFTAVASGTTLVSNPAPIHPEAQRISDFQTNMPSDVVWPESKRRGNIYYVGEPTTFGIAPAAKTYEVRDYDGNLVDSGVAQATTTVRVTQPGWYKLYLYGDHTTTTWGDVVGGTTFVILRDDPNFPRMPDVSNFYGDFVSPEFTRVDATVNFDWGWGSPASSLKTDGFGVIWKGQIQPTKSETYTFYVTGDDRARLYVNGQKLIDFWKDSGPAEATATITLQAGQRYDIELDYFEWLYAASTKLSWSSPGTPKQVIPASQLYPSATAASPGGLTGAYYNVFQSADSAMDPVIRDVMAIGPQRYAVTDASKPDEAIAQLKAAIALDSKLYTSQDPLRQRALLIAFPNGTSDLAGVRKIVEAFKDQVTYWEPRNEPNYSASGAQYVNNELIGFYNTVKSVDQSLKVIGPAVVTIGPYGLQWLEGFFQAGGKNYIDALSFHAYNDINGDLSLARKAMDALQQLLNKYGAGNIEKWQTEQGFMASVYGAYQPRLQARWTMLEEMVFEQYGLPKEHNHYWYDRDHGFRAFPMYYIHSDSSLDPVAPLLRVWSEELYGTNFTKAFDFGSAANNIFIGSLFSGPDKSVAAFMAPGSPDGLIQLKVSGGNRLHVVSAFGVASDIPVVNGIATLTVPELPVYVELAVGQNIDVMKPDWGANLARQSGVTASASGTGQHPGGAEWSNPISKITNGQIENWYWSQQPDSDIWVDNTVGFPAWVQINLPQVTTVDRVVIYAGVPWQWRGSLLDYDIQVDQGGQWVTVKTVKVDPKTIGVFTPATQTTVDSFYSDQYVFNESFDAVQTSKIRLFVRDATWGGGATEMVKEAGGQTGFHQIQLAEVEIYGK